MTFHKKHPIRRLFLSVFLTCALLLPQTSPARAAADDFPPFIVLSCYRASIPIDGEFLLAAVASNGKMPTFRSSKSSIASVNTYGVVTGKKSGTCTITAKIRRAEASCRVTVEKSVVTISKSRLTLENGASAGLSATVSTGHDVKWRSSSSAVAGVDENGTVTARTKGKATITVKVDGVSRTCRVTVKAP